MKEGDYIQSEGHIVQINTIDSIYKDATGSLLTDGRDIVIGDKVLLACGFEFNKEHSHYELQQNKNRIIIDCTRNQGGKYCCMICSPRTPLHAPDTLNHIVTLADLQDFVRICTSEELPINVTELADAIK